MTHTDRTGGCTKPRRLPPPLRLTLGGAPLTPMTTDELNALIAEVITADEQLVICSQNLHGLYVYQHDASVRALHEQSYIHVDGMPLIWLLWCKGVAVNRAHRNTYVDWLPSIAAMLRDRGWRMYYLGAPPGVAQQGIDRLKREFPGLAMEGRDGYFSRAETGAVIDQINRYRPHVLCVGMGMGTQERWVLDHLGELDCNVVLPSGAAIEYFAGYVKTPPRWLGPLGLEWLHRLLGNPGRFAFRYLMEPWLLAGIVLRRRVTGRPGPRETDRSG